MRQIGEQVVVITGASSGIGRETALELAEKGARVVLAARNPEALEEVAREVERAGVGDEPLTRVVDVSRWEEVRDLAQAAVDRFGRIDTWMNNAAVVEYATVEQSGVEEIERIIQVDLLGQIYGMKAALPHLRREGQGTIVNVASVLARVSVPYLAAYCAAKHGIKGFTDSLRLELEHERSPISVTLILPSSVNTPFFAHARSKLGVFPRPIPPVYEPRVVARAILFAIEHPRREIVVGGGQALLLLDRISPALVEWYMLQGGRMFKEQQSDRPDDDQDNLFAPLAGTGATTGSFGRISASTNLYTRYLGLYPERQRALAGVLLLTLLGLVRRFGR